MEDTSKIAERRYFELLSKQSPMQRLHAAVELSNSVRTLAEFSIRNSNPHISEHAVRARLAERLYGKRVAQTLFPILRQPMHDAIEIALRVAAAIEAVGGEYFIGGSLASSFQGEPRSTNDIDIVVSLAMSQLERFKLALGNDFEADLESLRDAFLRKGCANIFFLPSVMKIDIFAVGSSEFDAEEFRRRQSVRVRSSGETLFLKTAEDSILRKLLWFREGGEVSERQWRDVVALLRINSRSLDFSYIERWSRALRLDSLLRRAREASSQQLITRLEAEPLIDIAAS